MIPYYPQLTIGEIKEWLEEKIGVPLLQQRIIFKEGDLKDNETCQDKNIRKNDELLLFLR